MYHALLVIFLLIAIGLITLIMLQNGKGTDVGASFSSVTSVNLFCSNGSGNFMTRMTAVLAAVFFMLSLVLGNLSANHAQKGGKFDKIDNNTNQESLNMVQFEEPVKSRDPIHIG